MSGEWEFIGNCPVDAGCIVLVDPGYVRHDEEHLDPYQASLKWSDEDYKRGYAPLPMEEGMIVSSGLGDGNYPVYVKKFAGRVSEVKVVFIGEDEKEGIEEILRRQRHEHPRPL